MLQAKVAWLDAPLGWRDGRVVWLADGAEVLAEPGALSRTQRALNKVRTYPVAAAEALGDPEAWIAERQARLEFAKHLAGVHEPDLEGLARQFRSGSKEAADRLVALLPVEALALHPLPISPAKLLAAARTAPDLETLVGDPGLPERARMLAALVWGCRVRDGARHPDWPPAVQRALAFGRSSGLPEHPALALALLSHADGAALVFRLDAALAEAAPTGVGAVYVADLLQGGAEAESVVATVEALAAVRPVLDLIRRRKEDTPPRRRRVDPPEPTPEQRREWSAEIAEVAREYGRQAGAAAVEQLRLVAEAVLDLPAPIRPLTSFLREALSIGLPLPPPRAVAYLRLLHRLAAGYFTSLPREPEVLSRRSEGFWANEFSQITAARFCTLRRYLQVFSEELVERAFSGESPPSPLPPPVDDESLELLLDLKDLGVDTYALPYLLKTFPEPRQAILLLRRILRETEDMIPERRAHFLEQVVDWSYGSPDVIRRRLSRVPEVLDILITHVDPPDACVCQSLVGCADELALRHPARVREWLAWLVEWIASQREGWDWHACSGLERTVDLAGILSLGQHSRFETLLQAGLRHDFQDRAYSTFAGLELLREHPLVLRVLSDLFPRDPGRCVRLLTRLGLTPRFGMRAEQQADELEPRIEDAELAAADPVWSEILDRTPDLFADVAGYIRAARVCGMDPEPPASIRRLLQLPARLGRELKHLRARLASEPDRGDLASRAASLEARLLDPLRLDAQVAEELRDALPRLAGEQQVRALEALVDACYRARLIKLAGPAGDLPLDDDLRNAALLSVDIRSNRKLLRRLIRGHLRGERGWIRAHPENVKALERMRAAGVDTDAWLAENPRSFRCPSVKGGRVRLHLEQEPLRILQMGNYFDTCLSFGGGNAFSTVANACELNKRVIYATDGAGRVVGRKLIGINAEGKLIGFHTYTSGSDQASAAALNRIFFRYARRLASLCRLQMAEEGSVPRLFAEDWYDDGVAPWKYEGEEPARSRGNQTAASGV